MGGGDVEGWGTCRERQKEQGTSFSYTKNSSPVCVAGTA